MILINVYGIVLFSLAFSACNRSIPARWVSPVVFLPCLPSDWHPQPTHNETKRYRRSNIDRLPAELVSMVVQYLTPCDRICLAHCSHWLLSVLGNGHQMLLENGFRHIFLTRLSRDLPEYIHCGRCSALHHRKYIPPRGPALWPRRTLAKHRGHSHPWSFPFTIDWSSLYRSEHLHLQLAMKRHHCRS